MTKNLTNDQRELIDLSNAYLRLREILGAWNTPTAPTAQQVWKITEDAASKLVSERREMISMLKRIANCTLIPVGEGILSDIDSLIAKAEGKSQ